MIQSLVTVQRMGSGFVIKKDSWWPQEAQGVVR